MAEIQGAILATRELLGLLSELRLAYDSLSERVDKFRENREEFKVLKIAISVACDQMKLCKRTFEKYQQEFSDGFLLYEHINLEGIAKLLELVQKNVSELDKKLPERRKRFQEFLKAKGTARDIASQSSRIYYVRDKLAKVIGSLKSVVDETDIFKCDFSSVPRIEFPVYLDFSKPHTMEGKLMVKLLDQVKQSKHDEALHVTAVVGTNGMGGMGKTTALCKLAQERLVREAFPDGIHFIFVGKDATSADLVQKLKRIVRNSGGERWAGKIDDSGPLESAVETTSSWFAEKKVLFICDDLFQTPLSLWGYYKQLSRLLHHCPESYMIISTRNDRIGPQKSGKVLFEPRPTTGAAARGIFLKSAHLIEEDVSGSTINNLVIQILELCRGVPLTLSIAGAQVRLHDGAPMESLRRLLTFLRKKRLSLWEEGTLEEYPCFNETVKGSLEGIATFLEKDSNFMRNLSRHFKQCKTDYPRRTFDFFVDGFHRLCILPRNGRVSEDIVFGAWCISDAQIGWKILDALKDAHLLLEFAEAREEEFAFGIHDVVLDHCIEESKRNGNYRVIHREFLSQIYESNQIATPKSRTPASVHEMNAFWKPEECEKCRPWWRILSKRKSATENYILNSLFWHLREGKRLAEAIALLSHIRWTQLRIDCGGIEALKTDFDFIIDAMDVQSRVVDVEEKCACSIALEGINSIWEMIRTEWPRIIRHPASLPTHASWHFVRKQDRCWITKRYLESAERSASGPWLKFRSTIANDSETVDNALGTSRDIVGTTIMWLADQMIAATRTKLFWIDMKTVQSTQSQELHINDHISAIASCENGNLLVLGFESGRLQFRNTTTGKLHKEAPCGHAGLVTSVAVSTNGKTVVSGSYDSTVRVWNGESETAVSKPLQGHEYGVRSVTISADGRIAASCSDDKTVRMWNTQTGTTLGGPLLGHGGPVKSVVISADGRTVVSGGAIWNDTGADGEVIVWDVETRTVVDEALLPRSVSVTCLSISSNGLMFVSAAEDKSIRLWKRRKSQWSCYTVFLPSVASNVFFNDSNFDTDQRRRPRILCRMRGAQPVMFDVMEGANEDRG